MAVACLNAVADADLVFIAAGTGSRRGEGGNARWCIHYDLRKVYEPKRLRDMGFNYSSVGRCR